MSDLLNIIIEKSDNAGESEYLSSNNLNVTMITRTVISTLKVLQHWYFVFWIEHTGVLTRHLLIS